MYQLEESFSCLNIRHLVLFLNVLQYLTSLENADTSITQMLLSSVVEIALAAICNISHIKKGLKLQFMFVTVV